MYFYAFYPIGLDLPRQRRPVLSFGLIAVMVVAFLWTHYAPRLLPLSPRELIFWPGNGAPWSVATAVFLHGDWLHLLGNLAYLWVFAPALEDRLGRGRFLLLFLMLGIGGNLAHGLTALSGWFGQPLLGVLGASGAISGLLGLALVRLPHARVVLAYWVFAPLVGQNRAGRARLSLSVTVLAWLLLQVVHAAVAPITGTGVSYGAHFGGFVLGVALGLGLGLRREGRAEASLARAGELMARGQVYAALGEYEETLAHRPDAPAVQRERARALLLSGQREPARRLQRRLVRSALRAGRLDEALDVYLEGRRQDPGLELTAPELAELGHLFEKKGDLAAAVATYQDLVAVHPGHPAGDRAWVRIASLLSGDPERAAEARLWLHRAWHALPPGAWRDYLAVEFNLRAGPREAPAAEPAACRSAPGS